MLTFNGPGRGSEYLSEVGEGRRSALVYWRPLSWRFVLIALAILSTSASLAHGFDRATAQVQIRAQDQQQEPKQEQTLDQARRHPRLRHELEAAYRLRVVGRFDEAKEVYRELYERYPNDEAVITGYGETLLMSKSWGEAEALYLEVRDRSGKPLAYAKELEQIHMIQGRHREATHDCLDVLAGQASRLDWVRGELVRVSGEAEEGVDLVLEVLSERAQAEPQWPLPRVLAVEMLVRAKRSDEAARHLEDLREAGEINANHLYALAIQLEALGDMRTTLLALELVLLREGTVGAISGAAFKLSNLLARAGYPDRSRQVLEHLTQRYPNSTVAFKAQLELASLEAEVLGRPERALVLYEELLEQQRIPVDASQVKEASAYCLLRLGRLEEARERFAELAVQKGEGQHRTAFMAAEVSFFMGERDSALSLYAALASQHPEWDVANDALSRVFLIQEGTAPDEEPMNLFATAELLIAIDRPDSALAYLSSILENHPESSLVDDAMLRASYLHIELGDVDEALAMCRFVVEYDPEGRLAPLAQERIGDIWWEEKGDSQRALEEYTKGLDLYPHSLVAPRVRDKVARLRREVG